MHLQLCWESLIPMREEDDPFTKVQAWSFMASAAIFTHNITRSKHYLKRCVEIVKRNDIRFVLRSTEEDTDHVISSRSLEFTEEAHERAVLLGQILYWLTYLYLLDGHSEEFSSAIERQFRFELPVRTVRFVG